MNEITIVLVKKLKVATLSVTEIIKQSLISIGNEEITALKLTKEAPFPKRSQ